MNTTLTKDKVLLVDDEPNILSGYKRGLRQRFDVYTAEGGPKGLELIEESGPFAVIVADMRMPGMDGVQFLKTVRRISPDSTRMMLTGNADQETAMQAVNVGAIFRFLTKPCPVSELIAALALGIRQYRLVIAEKEILEKTLTGSIRVLIELLSISEPELISKAEKIRDMAQLMAPALGIENIWELEMAAMLSPLGALTQPPELRKKIVEAASLTDREKDAAAEIPVISARLLSHIPRLENVSRLAQVSGGFPDLDVVDIALENQPLEMKVMRILADFVGLENQGKDEVAAFEKMKTDRLRYDLDLVQKIQGIVKDGSVTREQHNMVAMEVPVKNLMNGDVLKQDVSSLDERLLLSKGTRITNIYLTRLNNYQRLVGIQEPIEIFRRVFPEQN